MNPPIPSTPQSSVPTLHQTIIKETVRNPEKINNQHNIESFSHKSKNYDLRHIVASIRMLWRVICKSIPWAKVNSCHMSIFIHVTSDNVCSMPKSICNKGNFTYWHERILTYEIKNSLLPSGIILYVALNSIQWSGRGAMGRVWVFQSRGPVFDSRRTAVVSGRASDLKCSCATLVYKSVDPHWYLK